MAVNKKIKVSEATVAKLRKGTMAGNLAKAKGASPEMKEALIRFYGAKRVNAAIGKSGPGSVKKPAPFTPSGNTREDRKPTPTSPKPSGGPGAKMPKRPAGGPGAKMTARDGRGTSTTKKNITTIKTGTGSKVNKPLIDLPAKLGSAQSKLDKKAAATQALLEKNKKARMANASTNKK